MWSLIIREFKEFFTNKKIIIFFAMVSIILIIGTCCSGEKIQKRGPKIANTVNIGVVDLDNSFYSNMLISYFENDEAFQMYGKIAKGTKEEIEKSFQKGELHGYLILPEKFAENLLGLKSSPIVSKINTKDMSIALILKNMLLSYEKYVYSVEVHAVGLLEYMLQKDMDQQLVQSTNFQISKDLIFTVLGRGDFFDKNVEKTLYDIPTGEYYFQAFMAVFFLFAGMYGGYHYLKDRQCGILERLKLVELSGRKYFFSKWICTGMIVTLTTIVICLIRGFFVGNKAAFDNWQSYLFAIFLSVFLGLLIGWFTKDTRVYLAVINSFYFCMCLIGGAIIPIMYLPESLVWIGKITPVYWFMQMFL